MRNLATALILAVAATPALAQGGRSEVDTRKSEIVNKLSTMRISVNFEGIPLSDALSFVREFSGINIVVGAEVGESLSDEQLRITLKVKDLLLKSVLKLMLSPRDLTATYKQGVLLIVPKGSVDKAVTLQLYDVRDLLIQLQDFPGPTVELVSPSAGGGPLAGATFSLDEPKATITEDFLVEMIQSNTGDRTWDENPNASMNLQNGILIVSQSRRVHAEIKRLVNLLRQFQ